MKKWMNQLSRLGLFPKLFLVMVVSIVLVSVLILWTTIHMSTNLFTETFSITNSKVLNQIKTNFESFNEAIAAVSNNVTQSGSIRGFLSEGDADSLTMAKSFYNMRETMDRIQSITESYEVGITIIGINGRSYSTNRAHLQLSVDELKQEPITMEAAETPSRLIFDDYQNEATIGSQQMISATKALTDRTRSRIYGTLYVTMREDIFRQFYSSFTSRGNDVVIMNEKGEIVSSNREDWIGTTQLDLLSYARDMNNNSPRSINARVMDQDSVVLSEYLPFYRFYIVNVVDKDLAMGQLIDMKTVALICAAIVVGALILVFLITSQITKSLRRLVKQMSNITKSDLDNYIPVSGSYESRQLGHAYNYMLDELHDYVDQLVQTQHEQRNAELAALQSQINPHFLYNTLASVKVLVQQGNKDRAAETINALIGLLQNTISDVSQTVTVEQEVENLKNYVFINHVRYGGRIKAAFYVAPDCTHYHVPKLVIQPFIENAFFHGFIKKETGTIHVMVSRAGESLICEIMDNGDGIEGLVMGETLPNPKNNRQLFSGIGIRNVHDRIELLYGSPYGVTIMSNVGEGTRVTVTLPLITS
ncbi:MULTISPECIES: cache domain-containing sensor histidine kinase [Paenibacillus]|jgi:two-component system sensor histidine kinase YesM|uniref:cache domain-containing sensor histidine kinase n=1 Tax=Paenibacillus TaxID=44249 RepID=UPI00087E1B9D|nr:MULTISPECIES: sensor histidine kinase [Paenibacillus]MCL6659468.1 sensor histidine kinase [Paenibacillus amylolyticus]TDL68239.1 sensor histidine kinase [Paenibacillus amylolyticus]WJM10357.1 sensor histidine kinase [Paenibacillus sp. PK1-4R]SDC81675.1 two-component system, sensor histidine kinase YesM [Paenibacillus sp. CF095]